MADAFPVTDLPNTLVMLLRNLLENNILNGWSIYESNKNNTVNVNIRFSGDSLDTMSPELRRSTASYRRVSDNQAARNKQRARQFRSKQKPKDNETVMNHFESAPVCDIVHPEPPCTDPSPVRDIVHSGPITRSRTVQDIENFRVDDSINNSPVCNTSVCSLNMSEYPNSPILIDRSFSTNNTDTQTENIDTVNNSTETASCNTNDNSTQTLYVIFPSVDDEKAFQLYEIEYSPETSCDNVGCLFSSVTHSGEFGDFFSPLCYCKKCDISVCERCYNIGAHQHHSSDLYDRVTGHKPYK